MKIHVSLGDQETPAYEKALGVRLKNTHHNIIKNPQDAEFLVFSPNSPISDFSQLPDLKLIQSIWAGVDAIINNPSLQTPLARLVDAGLSEGMREYVIGHILADHIEIKRFETAQKWDDQWLPLARSKTVGIIGIGVLGQSCATAAQAMGFNVLGWAQSEKSLPYPCYQGEEGLIQALSHSDYVVTLLPHTAQTENIINMAFFKAMKNNAMLINPGRGALLDEQALLEALSQNQLRRAVLDVFKTEPLPTDHPFWQNDKILITPHIAAKSRIETAIDVILQNIERVDQGLEPIYLVNRQSGY